ncbi:hypothetical protein SAMN05421594_0901 [Chryseobacterium oleae]|uniref:Uncharacterized protein n=1 Tax=Chryseobacterium oleae TaxID=491207 RepID=A0A1I4W5D0_CHROL|nr:hypothetical protein SAMN05421594_0901 [Chryseobacterium oleae]
MFLNGEKRGESGFESWRVCELESRRVGAFWGLRVKLRFDNDGYWLLGASKYETQIQYPIFASRNKKKLP